VLRPTRTSIGTSKGSFSPTLSTLETRAENRGVPVAASAIDRPGAVFPILAKDRPAMGFPV